MNKKIIIISLLSLCLFTTSYNTSNYAEETNNSQYFKVDYEIGRQSVWTNAIPINVYIIPKADYNRVEITFSHGSMTNVKYKGSQYFPVKSGETYKTQGKIYPKEKGPHHITINAIAWEHNTNYTSSSSASIYVDENLKIVPQTQTYKILNVLKYFFITAVIIGLAIGTYFLLKKNLLKIKKWLEPEY